MAATARAPKRTSIGAAILDQFANLDAGSLSAATARELLGIGFEPATRARVKRLLAKAQADRISDVERDELDEYLHVADMVAILHSKARQALKRTSQEP